MNEINDENKINSVPDKVEPKKSKKEAERPQTPPKIEIQTAPKEKEEETPVNLVIERDPNSPPIYPEVYRKRGTSNLHERLKKEIEVNDSYLNFQKLMHNYQKKREQIKKRSKRFLSRKPSDPDLTAKKAKLNDLTNKYKDSLWFSHQQPIIKKKKIRKNDLSREIENKSIKRSNKTSFPSCTHLKLPDVQKTPKKKGKSI